MSSLAQSSRSDVLSALVSAATISVQETACAFLSERADAREGRRPVDRFAIIGRPRGMRAASPSTKCSVRSNPIEAGRRR